MQDELTPYVPRLLREWEAQATAPAHRRDDATLVFTDLSGFTALSERLARLGRLGAEELVESLDATFSVLLARAAELGGEMIKFGGDALLLIFTGEGHTGRGAAAAHAMQADLRRAGRRRTSVGAVTLRMSVGLHSGPTDLFLVGGSNRELVVAGPAATEVVAMEAAADAGEILVSGAAANRLSGATLGQERVGGFLLRSPPPATEHLPTAHLGGEEAVAARCIPVALRSHLAAGGHEPEHRQVAVGFVWIRGIDSELAGSTGQEVAAALHGTITAIQQELDEHSVSLVATDVAADGTKLQVCAGAPAALGDNEERLLRALRRAVDRAGPLPLQAGAHRGHAFTGDIGPPFRRTYVVMGDVVNTAARVMARAGAGEILATKQVLQQSATTFSSEELPPFAAKGKAEPLVAHRVGAMGPRRRRRRHVPLVGREAELAQLRQALEQARAGRGGAVEVVAEPGLGKSRLADELREEAAASGTDVVDIMGHPYERAAAWAAIRLPLRSLLGIERDTDPDHCAAQLRATVDERAPHLSRWLPLLAAALGATVASDALSGLDDRTATARLHEAVIGLVDASWPTPLLWVVDDAHLLDGASRALVEHLARAAAERRWLVLTLAPPERPPLEGAVVLELSPLDPEEAASLVRATSGEALLPQQAARLAARSGGNPLFAEELAAAYQTAGDIDTLPDSVDATVTARLDRLPPKARTVLRFASVLGRTVDPELLRELAGPLAGDLPSILPDVDELLEPHGTQLQFRHAVIRDVSYAGLTFRRRRGLHEQLAGLLETREADAATLSLHFHAAQRHDRAWPLACVAAEEARARWAPSDAAVLWERAIASGRRSGAPPDELAWAWRSLGDATSVVGELERAASAYRTARRLASAPEDRAHLLFLEGTVHEDTGSYRRALILYGRGLGLLDRAGAADVGTARTRVRLLVARAVIRLRQGRLGDCIRLCEGAADLAEATGDVGGMAHAMNHLQIAHTHMRTGRGAEYGQRALQLFEELGEKALQGPVLNTMGVDAYFKGDWGQALELYAQARRTQQESGRVVEASVFSCNIAEILLQQNRPREARAELEPARETLAAARSQYLAVADRLLALVASAEGSHEDAIKRLQAAVDAFREMGADTEADVTVAHLVEALVSAGRLDEAGHHLETLADCEGDVAHLASRARGLLLLARGAAGEAASELERAATMAEEVGSPYDALVARAEAARARGDVVAEAEAAEGLASLGVREPRPRT